MAADTRHRLTILRNRLAAVKSAAVVDRGRRAAVMKASGDAAIKDALVKMAEHTVAFRGKKAEVFVSEREARCGGEEGSKRCVD
jgi:hypothetical protein